MITEIFIFLNWFGDLYQNITTTDITMKVDSCNLKFKYNLVSYNINVNLLLKTRNYLNSNIFIKYARIFS